jgi:hypothetical protein
MTITINGTTGIAGVDGSAGTPAVQGTDTNTGIFFPAADTIAFGEGGAEVMRINSSGDVGIGTTSPNIGGVNKALTLNSATSTNCSYELAVNGVQQAGIYTTVSNSALSINNVVNGPMTFLTNNAERSRITSAGVVCINETTQINGGRLCVTDNLNNFNLVSLKNSVTQVAGQNFVTFVNSAGNEAGKIGHTGTTTVAYTTSSDYRLKENVVRMANALDKVMQLNPVTYTWKEDKKLGQGFIAHELQAVVPDCVTGEKDAVDADGNPKYQGIDTSFLVATLTAAIQELKAELDTTKARLAALEAQ